MTYIKPQVLVFQEYSLAPSELTNPLRAHISGPNAMLHRYSSATERIGINVGAYNRLIGGTYPWPGRTAGSLVDQASAKLHVENALLLYFEDLIGVATGGRGAIAPVSGHKNWIRSSAVAFKSNGTSWPRSGLLYDRDVEIGDVVYLRGVADPGGDCTEYELWTTVQNFSADVVDPTIMPVERDDNNAATTAATHTVTKVGGPDNCVSMVWNGASNYNGLPSGNISETYTVEVVKSGVTGCTAARLRITSASGTDDVDELDPGEFGDLVSVGTRGVKVTFAVGSGACEDDADADGVAASELVIGQKWTVAVQQAFERTCAVTNDTYTGPDDDTYVVTVTKGGTWSQLPQVTVTTTKGLDASGPTTVTGTNVSFPVGTYGLTMQFADCGNLPDSLSIAENDESGMGDDTLPGLRKGDKFYVTVTTGAHGPIRTLVLRDDIPAAIRAAEDLDLRLFIPKTIEVTKNRLSSPPLTNYSLEATQMVVSDGITAYDSTWTDNGVELPLTVWDGVAQSVSNPTTYGTLYIEYREWLTALTGDIGFISDIGEIDAIPGPLDVLNPLKWGVYKALQNSNGTMVAYTAVADPDSLDAWQDVLALTKGRDDLYNFAPLTNNREVQGLFQAQASDDSSPEAGTWKALFVPLQGKTTKMLVGKSDAAVQALTPTSTNGDVVLATLEDNPSASGTQYTLLSVPANNSGFLTYGVKAGDVVRYLYSIDAFGDATYSEYVVDRVLTENSLLLLAGPASPVTVAQKVEIWHPFTKDQIVDDVIDQAQSFANNLVCAVWPDIVGTAGVSQPGMFLAAALAGAVSGVVPHQSLTNVELSGFDDLASRTTKLFTSTQLNRMAAGGVWIATEDRNGTPYTRHGLTTSTVDLKHQEEMFRRNLHSISYYFRNLMTPYVGRTNAVPSMLRKLRNVITQGLKFLKANEYTDDLGAQIVEGTIAQDTDGTEILRVYPLAADSVEVALDLTLPFATNKIRLHLVV